MKNETPVLPCHVGAGGDGPHVACSADAPVGLRRRARSLRVREERAAPVSGAITGYAAAVLPGGRRGAAGWTLYEFPRQRVVVMRGRGGANGLTRCARRPRGVLPYLARVVDGTGGQGPGPSPTTRAVPARRRIGSDAGGPVIEPSSRTLRSFRVERHAPPGRRGAREVDEEQWRRRPDIAFLDALRVCAPAARCCGHPAQSADK